MRLSQAQISGYRNLESLDITFEADTTVLVGVNNCGKTNVLDALYAGLRVNRTVRQGAFELNDYHLATTTAMAGDYGPITITVTFSEAVPEEWSDDVVSTFAEVLILEPTLDLNSLKLSVTSVAPGAGREEEYSWAFLNENGEKRTGRRTKELADLQRLRPYFQLRAIREAVREFGKRSPYFSPFISDPTFDEVTRDAISTSLAGINETVLKSHDAFSALSDSLESGSAIISGSDATILIEAVPSRLSELLANTQVSLGLTGGAALPLERHGSGTQSIAVLSLFNAFVRSKLAAKYDAESHAILTIEEPEGHLHPNAIRQLWAQLIELDAQVIVTTHSGDLLTEVPLRCIRRLKKAHDGVRAYQVTISDFDERELQNLNYGIRVSRGELFLADVWLLVEGRTELIGLSEIAKATGHGFLAKGVRIVEYQQAGGPSPFIKLADQLGIGWFVICDGDASENATAAREQLGARTESHHLLQFEEKNIEAFLIRNGFFDIYHSLIPDQSRATISADYGTVEHSNQCARALPKKRKSEAIVAVSDAIKKGTHNIPASLQAVFDQCSVLSG